MAEQKIVRENLKAPKLEQYFKDAGISGFNKEVGQKIVDGKAVGPDDAHTVLFRSSIIIDGRRFFFTIITDSTIYTIVRFQMGEGIVNEVNREKVESFLNEMNRSYKVFKYVSTEDGSVFLDACMPSSNESFDPQVVRIVLEVMVDHIQNLKADRDGKLAKAGYKDFIDSFGHKEEQK